MIKKKLHDNNAASFTNINSYSESPEVEAPGASVINGTISKAEVKLILQSCADHPKATLWPSKKKTVLAAFCCTFIIIVFLMGFGFGSIFASDGDVTENNYASGKDVIHHETETFFTFSPDTERPSIPTTTVPQTTSTPEPTTTTTAAPPTSTTTTDPPTIPTTTAQPTSTTTLFQHREIKVHGDLNYLLHDQTSAVFSPFGIDFILSFFGNLGGSKEKSAVNTYFGTPQLSDIYVYFNDLKNSLFPGKFICNFVTGFSNDRFMVEQSRFDDVAVYPASTLHSYANYFNELIQKRSYDTSTQIPFFTDDSFATPQMTAVGFSYIELELEFLYVGEGLIKNHFFVGEKEIKQLDFFATISKRRECENYLLHAIPFKNSDFVMFVAEHLKDRSIPIVNPSEIFDNLKQLLISQAAGDTNLVLIPQFSQKNTVDVSPYFNHILNEKLSIYALFNNETTFEKDIYDLKKYFQALRFDVSIEGINRPHSKDYGFAIPINNPHIINKSFIYGIVYKSEIMIYYGVFA